MTPEIDMNALTGLFEHPGFETLKRHYRNQLNFIEDALQNTTEPAKFLELGRVWQAVRIFVKLLETEPVQAAQYMANEALARFEKIEKNLAGQLNLDLEQ